MSEASKALNKAFAAFQKDPNGQEAFAHLRAELLNLANGAIYSIFGQAAGAESEDIVSEILQALPTYHGKNKASFSTWAFGIAKREAIDALRQMKGGRRRGRLELAAKKPVEAIPSPEDLASLYAYVNSVPVTEKQRQLVRQILGKGLGHPLSAADRQRFSRLCKKLGLRDVTRTATNK